VDGGPVGIRAYKEDTIIDISMLEKILFVARYISALILTNNREEIFSD
jgi:hypothetical protein